MLTRPIVPVVFLCLAAGLCLASAPAKALTLGAIDDASFDALTGDLVASLVDTYDFVPEVNGGDGTLTSQVFQGAGAAAGSYVYSYRIELFDAPPASIGAIWGMQWQFGAMPTLLPGVGEAFSVADSGDVAPLIASWSDGVASFLFVPSVGNGQTSQVFGLLSPNAPAEASAQLIDSGALGGTARALSNGEPAIPEPGAALVFGIGLLLLGPAVSRRR